MDSTYNRLVPGCPGRPLSPFRPGKIIPGGPGWPLSPFAPGKPEGPGGPGRAIT